MYWVLRTPHGFKTNLKNGEEGVTIPQENDDSKNLYILFESALIAQRVGQFQGIESNYLEWAAISNLQWVELVQLGFSISDCKKVFAVPEMERL